MAILNATNVTSATDAPPQTQPNPQKPALFIRTLLPPTSPPLTHICTLLPTPPYPQLIIAHETYLTLHTIHLPTHSLHPICHYPLHTTLHAISSLPTPNPHHNVLLLLSTSATLTFLQFDPTLHNLRIRGRTTLPLSNPRLLTAHPSTSLIAVAALHSTLAIFPALFLPKTISAGKIATHETNAQIQALIFLPSSQSHPLRLATLLQSSLRQSLALFSISTPSHQTSSRILAITPLATLSTCTIPTNIFHTPTSPATHLAALPNLPHHLALLSPGKITPISLSALLTSQPTQPPRSPQHHTSPFTSPLPRTPDTTNIPLHPPLQTPPSVSLSIPGDPSIPLAFAPAPTHFSTPDDPLASALYFVLQSGALYVLRWAGRPDPALQQYLIPRPHRIQQPSVHFSLEFVADVGPAASLAPLDFRLLFVANEGADSSLRRVHLPEGGRATEATPASRRYGLEVRQEFLSLAPVSDFVIAPSIHPTAPRAVVGPSQPRARGGDVLEGDYSAIGHVLYGGENENDIVTCSGFGQYGTVRLIRPGAPVSIFASSEPSFPACNDMWPIRLTTNASHDTAIVLTFVQGTGLLYSLPVPKEDPARIDHPNPLPTIANLIDGTAATGILSNCRSVAVATLQDRVLAQIYANGIRLIFMRAVDDFTTLQQNPQHDALIEPVFETTLDWSLPVPGSISVGAIGAGFILICVVREGNQNPLLLLLKLHPDHPTNSLLLVASADLNVELSCITIPEWSSNHLQSDFDTKSPQYPPIAILGTYAPSIELRLLCPTMDVVDQRSTVPWSLVSPSDVATASQKRAATTAIPDASVAMDTNASDKPDMSDALFKYSKARVESMSAVPESLCTHQFDGIKMLFVGLRDGSVIRFSFRTPDGTEPIPTASQTAASHLLTESHRKLGHRPVMVKVATVAIGNVILAQSERPWICCSLGGGNMRWIPLSFIPTSAICSYSVPGAQRCFAAVGEDNSLHICGLRRRCDVSVRSIHVGATPRRVLTISSPEHSFVVATSREHRSDEHSPDGGDARNGTESSEPRKGLAELRIYNRRLCVQTGSTSLLPGEQVHVLLNWMGFVVVGTSIDLRLNPTSGVQKICKLGRLLLYSVQPRRLSGRSSSRSAGKTKLTLCAEVVLPGAVLSGAAHPTASILVVSCNEEVIIFGTPRTKSALIEKQRLTARSVVVSLSICEDMMAVVDRKDSIVFFALDAAKGEWVRERSDNRRRLVSDAVMVDRTLAIAVDRRGALFSIGYEEGDEPKQSPACRTDGSAALSFLETAEWTEDSNEGLDDDPNGETHGPSDGLGEEFDDMQTEGDAENANENNDQLGDPLTGAGEIGGAANAGNPFGVMGDAATMTATMAAGLATAAAAQGNMIPIPLAELPNAVGLTNENPLDQVGQAGQFTPTRRTEGITIPRNLVCHHSFGMNDTSLRIQVGRFNRRETAEKHEYEKSKLWPGGQQKQRQFFDDESSAVLCGTLGGAIVSAVPMLPSTYALLSQVEGELSVHPDLAGPTLGSSHMKFRSAFEARAKGTVDGDLLDRFDTMNRSSKLEIAARVGHGGERGVMHIEALIRDLFDRVA